MKVDKCLCHNRSFEEIRRLAEEDSCDSVEQLQAADLCGRGCGLCIPYVEILLETGQTSFKPGEFYRKGETGS
ncbi:MAG: (2Fe-2S)-binding protein [Balneolaceae bacterium]|nr:(2Fe-2S)-binding protein [Balneolaceae bacterium]